MSPQQRTVQLIDARDLARPMIPARLLRDFPSTQLDSVELVWAHVRELAAVGESNPIDHAHWNWRNKAESVLAGIHRLVAVECETEIQGLMAILQAPRTSRLTEGNVVYVDYVETAPWNLKSSFALPRFLGVGTLLLADAVRQSHETGLSGAIGLHSLPQAESFYARMGMTRFGPDPGYHDLVYFEYDGKKALVWLHSIGEAI